MDKLIQRSTARRVPSSRLEFNTMIQGADGRNARLVGQRRQRQVAAGQGRGCRRGKGRLCRGNVQRHRPRAK